LVRLSRPQEGWVQVQCLRVIESLGDGLYLDVIRQFVERSPREFLRVQALRAAGGIRGPASVDVCMQALETGSPAAGAQAIESLVRLRCDPGTLSRAA